MLDSELLARIDARPQRSFRGLAFRHVAADRDPQSGEGARVAGGRWNPPQSFAVLYLALDEATVAREFQRLAARSGRSPADFLPRTMYTYAVDLRDLLDLEQAGALEELGASLEVITSDDVSQCQEIGRHAHYLGREGVMAPSATGSGTVLAVYVDRLHAGSEISVVDAEAWTSPAP